MSKARWTEFVAEYGNLDEVKNVFALEQQTIENYEIKINKKFTLKSLFTNRSYAVDVDGIKTYYPVKGSRLDVKKEKETLQRTIKYEESLNDDDLDLSSDKVQLYKIDLELLPSISGVKRRYAVNIVSGKLYSLDEIKYEGLVYHTPKYGVKKDEQEKMITIYYLSGDGEKKIIHEQKVKQSDAKSVTLDNFEDMKFIRDGYEFIKWEDITAEYIKDDTFMPITEGYYKVTNELSNIFGTGWLDEIINIIEIHKIENTTEETVRDIRGYINDERIKINEKLAEENLEEDLDKLAEWFVSNVQYLENLKDYELKDTQEETTIENDENNGIFYDNQEKNVNVSDDGMWLNAIWEDSTLIGKLTLDANGDNATVNGKEKDEINVIIGKSYEDVLSNVLVERTEYVFAGWWTDATNGTQVIGTDIYDGTIDKLYAHWENKESSNVFRIRFYPEAGGKMQQYIGNKKWKDLDCDEYYEISAVRDTKIGIKLGLLWEGVRFEGWYESNGTQVNEKTVVEKNMDLYPNIIRVKLELGDGAELKERWSTFKDAYKYQDKIETHFNNWNPKKYGEIRVQNNMPIQNQINGGSQLPLRWKRNDYYATANDVNYCRYPQKIRKISTDDGLISLNAISTFDGWYTRTKWNRHKNIKIQQCLE